MTRGREVYVLFVSLLCFAWMLKSLTKGFYYFTAAHANGDAGGRFGKSRRRTESGESWRRSSAGSGSGEVSSTGSLDNM